MRLLLTLLTCLGTPALADCPDASDMGHGVRLWDDVGGTETFYTQSHHLVRGEYEDGQGYGARYLLLAGTYVVQVFDTENGAPLPDTRTTTLYPVAPETRPQITPGSRWDAKAIVHEANDIYNSNESHIFGPDTEISIGDCNYGMIPIISIYHDQDGYEERLNYLPEFGFAYLVEMKDRDEAPVRYGYTKIEAVAD